ncbi:hypothetical protein [Lactococcus lactis]|uniref:hypothetical protein n=1 Tax=Lactococcus lactis TaxID=1358 RepID=UPI0019678274|nr:hypothetical protein [Lactococcus lactis]
MMASATVTISAIGIPTKANIPRIAFNVAVDAPRDATAKIAAKYDKEIPNRPYGSVAKFSDKSILV